MDMKWTITAGDLLTAISILIGAFGVYNRLTNRQDSIETRLEPIFEWFINRNGGSCDINNCPFHKKVEGG